MKRRRMMPASAVLIAVTLALSASLSAQSTYAVTNLGTLGGSNSAAISLNNAGLISGYSFLPGNQTEVAVVWQNGTAIPLGTLGGPNSGVEWPNHNSTAVVGIAETAAMDALQEDWSCSYGGFFFPTVTGHVCLGFVWQNGVMSPLPTLGGINGYAAGANNAGQVVGWAETPVHDSTCVAPQVLQFEAVLWGPKRGQVQSLPPLAGDPDSAATAINNRGQVVGISGICENAVGDLSARHAVLWQNGVPIDLKSLGGSAWNTPTAINQKGQVVGFSENQNGDIHAFLWTVNGGMQDLGTLAGDSVSFAYGINNQGQIVGQSIGPNGSRAVIWENGQMMDLNGLTLAGSPDLIFAQDINDSGTITGEAYDSGTGLAPAYVAVPTETEGNSQAALAVKDGGHGAPAILPPNIDRMFHRTYKFGRMGPRR